MLTYTPRSESLPKPTEKPWLLLLLTFIWLWPGVIGHDPWKPDEPQIVEMLRHMLASGDAIVPSLLGRPVLDTPPLYYWVAACFARLFSPWLLDFDDAARLATPFFMALALTFAGGAGRELIGRRHGRSVVLILIGCFGMIVTGHQLNNVVAAYAGFSAAFYALTLALRAPALGGALLGAATAALFLSSSLLEVALVWTVVLMLPAFSTWRHKRHAIMVAMALFVALPLSVIWPVLLKGHEPELYRLWWQRYALGPLGGFARVSLFHSAGYYFQTVLWYAFPAWPLAAWALYRNRQRLDQARIQLPMMFFGVVLVMLTLSSKLGSESAMPLLLPLAMLAALELDTLRRGGAAFLNWFGVMTFGLFSLLVWLGWMAMNFGWPARLAARGLYFSPYYLPHVSWLAAAFAVVATLLWLWAVTRKHLRGRQSVTNWAAGITLFWGLLLTLWLPWLDAAKSYRPVVEHMMAALPADARQCVAVEQEQTLARLSWAEYGGLTLRPYAADEVPPCDVQLLVRRRDEGTAEPGWTVLWQGARPRDKNEQYVLLRRQR